MSTKDTPTTNTAAARLSTQAARQCAEAATRAAREAQDVVTERRADLSTAERIARVMKCTSKAAEREARQAEEARVAQEAREAREPPSAHHHTSCLATPWLSTLEVRQCAEIAARGLREAQDVVAARRADLSEAERIARIAEIAAEDARQEAAKQDAQEATP